MTFFKENHLNIEGFDLKVVQDFSSSTEFKNNNQYKILLPQSDVVKFIYDPTTWIVLRPSGTEPKLKIYYSTKQNSQRLHNELLNVLMINVLK